MTEPKQYLRLKDGKVFILRRIWQNRSWSDGQWHAYGDQKVTYQGTRNDKPFGPGRTMPLERWEREFISL